MIFIFLNIAIMIFFCIYWCINEKIGFQLSVVVLLSTWTTHFINIFLKNIDIKFLVNIEIGWIVIAIFFCGYLLLRKKIEALFLKGSYRIYMILTAVVSFLLIIYHPHPYFVVPGGVLLGLGLGFCLNKKFIGFDAVNILQRTGIKKYLTLLARAALGILVLLLMVYRIEKIIYGMSEKQNIFLYAFLCYALTGFWITIAAPWLFIKLRLAGTIFNAEDSNIDKKSEHKYGSHWFR